MFRLTSDPASGPGVPVSPITKQAAAALNISRGSVYYLPRPVSAADLALMRRIDELHLKFPFCGIDPEVYRADTLARIINGHPNSRIDYLLPWAYAKPLLKDVA